MVLLYLSFILVALAASLALFRSPLHPHFLFTLAFSNVLVIPYIAEGNEHPLIQVIATPERYYYQLDLLVAYVAVLFTTAIYALMRPVNLRFSSIMPRPSRSQAAWIAFTSVAFIFLEIGKRLYATDWSIDDAIHHSLAPRGEQPWSRKTLTGGALHFYFLIGFTMPLAGVAFAYLSAAMRRGRLLNTAGLLITCMLLLTEGSRTPLVFVLGAWIVFSLLFQRTWFTRLLPVALAGGLIVVGTSIMIEYRATGLSNFVDARFGIDESSFETRYHQDDSYYWALLALQHADETGERLEAKDFFLSMLVNPIPRAWWPGKPQTDKSYWKGFKPYWITSSVFGEMIGIFGSILGLVIGWIMASLSYVLLHRVSPIALRPLGIMPYLAIALYVYMFLRSALNLTQFIYLPAAVFLVYALFSRSGKRRRKTMQRRPIAPTLQQPPRPPEELRHAPHTRSLAGTRPRTPAHR